MKGFKLFLRGYKLTKKSDELEKPQFVTYLNSYVFYPLVS
jgi:hypothetical protein